MILYAVLKRVDELKIHEVDKGCTNAWRWKWIEILDVDTDIEFAQDEMDRWTFDNECKGLHVKSICPILVFSFSEISQVDT